jgi:hypothetical protein
VKDMLGQVSFSQMFLMGKMQAALNAYNPTIPPTPGQLSNILVAAGTGQHEIANAVTTMVVPFGAPLLQIGNYVFETDDSSFNILTTGRYEIHYQIAVNEPGRPAADIHLNCELTSLKLGVLDAFTFPQMAFTLQQRTVTVDLQAGDILNLRVNVNGADTSNIEVESQAITFVAQ